MMLTQERLKEILDYDTDSGVFRWRVKKARWTKIGSKTGCDNKSGHLVIRIDQKNYLCHRLAWLYIYGKWPTEQIDHINGDGCDNRICNLRQATHAQNTRNVRRHRDSESKYKGIYIDKRVGRWVAKICVNKKSIHIGIYKNEEMAAKAYDTAALKYHGEFACLNFPIRKTA